MRVFGWTKSFRGYAEETIDFAKDHKVTRLLTVFFLRTTSRISLAQLGDGVVSCV
jgi:hypothetical protein